MWSGRGQQDHKQAVDGGDLRKRAACALEEVLGERQVAATDPGESLLGAILGGGVLDLLDPPIAVPKGEVGV
jgi:hypothetical protein